MHIPCVIAHISIHIVLPGQSRSLGSYLTTQRNKSPRICEAIGNSHSTELPGQAKANAFWKKTMFQKEMQGVKYFIEYLEYSCSFKFLYVPLRRGLQGIPSLSCREKHCSTQTHGPQLSLLSFFTLVRQVPGIKTGQMGDILIQAQCHNVRDKSNYQQPTSSTTIQTMEALRRNPCQARGSSTFLLSDHLGI